MVLRTELARLDSFISWSLGRILPRNLTARYLLALGVVAALSISGQLLIQLSLTRQIEMQDQIRLLDTSIPVTETLRKNALVLQLSSSAREMEKQAAAIKTVSEHLSFKSAAALLPPQREQALQTSIAAISREADGLHRLLTSGRGRAGGRARQKTIGVAADSLISAITQANEQLQVATTYLELEHRRQVKEFRKIELLLTLLTLWVLLLEALYIFRPAVERLYDALRVRSDFLSRMSHEIRNPMNSIIGMANLLLETPINDQQKRYVSILRRSSRGLLDMLNSLLDFSSLESGKFKLESIAFDLYDVLERALDMAVVGAHANGIELLLDLDPKVPLKLVGDPSRLFQVLTNLLGNAVKFTKRGQVTLRVQPHGEGTPSRITFSVIDTGLGIDPRKLESIFDAFVQEDSSVKRRFGGTGLGLSIARQLVERMGGQLSVRSAKDAGSTFSFTIALETSGQHSVAKFIADHPVAPFKATLVENNGAIAEVVKQLVTINGGSCERLEDNKKLLEAVLTPEDHHVVILDYESVKSEMSSFLPMLAKRDLDTARLIILLKSTASAGDLETLGRIGVKNLLFKPVRPLQFVEALSASLSPAGEARVEPGSESAPERPSPPLRPLSILVSDDSHDNQMLIELYLQATPHKLVFANDGREALQKFKEGRFDLVFMDLQMPEMDGYSATEAIRKWERALRLRAVPIIAISAHDSSHDVERFKSAGFTGHLVKPIDAVELRRLVRERASAPKPTDMQPGARPSAMRSEGEEDQTVAQIEQQVARLAPAYLENRRKELVRLRELAAASDFKSIQTIGHRLRGNATSYGFAGLAEIGAELEAAAQAQDLEKIRALVEKAAAFVASVS